MQKHKFDTRTETKSSLSKQVLERQRHEHEAQRIRLTQRGPFAPVIRGIGNVSSAGVHASMLNRATNGRPSRAGQSLLRLQMQYGNRYVQRVLALAGKGAGEAEAAPEVEQSIQQARGGGHGIDSRVRGQMESAFGADFGNVRLHTDTQADTLNRELNARAFTTGQDIFFRQDAYNPGNSSGRELIAHELTHVVQQNGDKVQRKLTLGQPGDKYEQEADQVALSVIKWEHQAVSTGVDQGSVRRQIEEDKEEETIQTKPEDFGVQRQAEGECTSRTSRGNRSLVKELTNVKLQNTSLKVQRENGPAAKKIPAVVTSTDISQEIKIRLDHIANHVDTAISSFENWFNKTSVKVGDLDPFAKFFDLCG